MREHLSYIRTVWAARAEPENLPILARWYWHFLLYVSMVGIVGIIWSGASFFWNVQSSLEPKQVAAQRRVSTIDRAQLSALDEAFAHREAVFGLGTVMLPAPLDPSL